MRELATLKAIGASPAIVSFVAWQAAFLALVGGGLGLGMAFGVRNLAVDAGLTSRAFAGPVLGVGCRRCS